MPSANVDLVRSIYAALERGNFSSAEWAHPEIEFVLIGGPSDGRWSGLAGMSEGWRDWTSMSKQNVDVARRSWNAWSRGDIEEGLSCYAVDAEWDMSTFSGWPEQQLFRGHGEIRKFLERWRGAWDDYEAGVDEFIDAGDKVCVLCWQRGRSKEAGVQVEMMAYAHVLAVRDGKITRAELHSERQTALEAAGLSEQDVRTDSS